MKREEKTIAHFVLTPKDAPYHDSLIELFNFAESIVELVEKRTTQLMGNEEQRKSAKEE